MSRSRLVVAVPLGNLDGSARELERNKLSDFSTPGVASGTQWPWSHSHFAGALSGALPGGLEDAILADVKQAARAGFIDTAIAARP